MSKHTQPNHPSATWETVIHDVVSARGAAFARDLALRAGLLVQLRVHVGPEVTPGSLTERQARSWLRTLPPSLAAAGREVVRELRAAVKFAGSAR